MNYNNGATESVDVLMPTDMDGIDDIAEEAHHRRASYTNDVKDEGLNGSRERGDREERGREDERRNDDRSRDRGHSSREGGRDHHHRSGSPSRIERDDKYNRRPSGSERERRRSRSRSPARHGTVRDRRVYVGNLSYDVKWTNLKDFMRE
ncbi:hypothetical protein CPC16_004195, partial [Podila verticillata]